MTIHNDGPIQLQRGYHHLTVSADSIKLERTATGHLLDWIERILLWILPYIPLEKPYKKMLDNKRRV